MMVLERLCKEHNIVMPTVTFDLRGSDAGEAFVPFNLINLNMTLFRENFDDYVFNTIPHELAHVWQGQLKLRGQPHGREWKSLMKRLGAPPIRCHNLLTDAAESRTGNFLYRCLCRPANMVGLELHRKIQQNPQAFRCDRCHNLFRRIG
jgi:SprT protein